MHSHFERIFIHKLDLYTDFSGIAVFINAFAYIANGRNPDKSVRSRTRNYLSIAYALSQGNFIGGKTGT